ncbi:MAG: N-(5'-phosphoribosyl)anthranilate isomerase [marine bacterium B5-7]|nr:MAG: N-(5'-phosphoribosyl)anthranilate isomerase [marine bacterium B5-7]
MGQGSVIHTQPKNEHQLVRTRVKICGTTRPEDAAAAVDAGADAVGVIFFEPSPRCAHIDAAAAIREQIPAFVSLVLVTVDLDIERHHQWIDALRPDVLQFQGSESPALCEQFGLPYIKALRMRDDVDIASFESRYRSARALHLETYVEGLVGGTGQSFDWHRARLCKTLPVILAGGLDSATVSEAIAAARPFAVDVSSSLESQPGIKDHYAIHEFMNAVKSADSTICQTTSQNTAQ